jgi:hypothetical protein
LDLGVVVVCEIDLGQRAETARVAEGVAATAAAEKLGEQRERLCLELRLWRL